MVKDTGFCNNHSGTDPRIFLGSTGLRTHLMKDIPPTPVTGTHQLNHLRSLGLPTSGLNSQQEVLNSAKTVMYRVATA